MENEKPAPPERRPLDVFDPSGDGHEPHSLAEVIQRGQEVLDSIDRFQAGLYGCMTPLDFAAEHREMQKLRERASQMLEPVRTAQYIIEMDLPLATATGEEELFDDPWAPPKGSERTLRPDDILAVRLRARQVGPNEQTTYRAEVEKLTKIPWLIQRDRRRAAASARRAAMTEEQKEARREMRRRSFSKPVPEPQPESAQEQVDRMNREMAAELDAVMEDREPDTNHFG